MYFYPWLVLAGTCLHCALISFFFWKITHLLCLLLFDGLFLAALLLLSLEWLCLIILIGKQRSFRLCGKNRLVRWKSPFGYLNLTSTVVYTIEISTRKSNSVNFRAFSTKLRNTSHSSLHNWRGRNLLGVFVDITHPIWFSSRKLSTPINSDDRCFRFCLILT